MAIKSKKNDLDKELKDAAYRVLTRALKRFLAKELTPEQVQEAIDHQVHVVAKCLTCGFPRLFSRFTNLNPPLKLYCPKCQTAREFQVVERKADGSDKHSGSEQQRQ